MSMYSKLHRFNYNTRTFFNRPKFEAIVSECDNILNSINQSPSAPSKPAPGFEEFRQYMDQRISTQETLLQRIAQELGLDKPKQQ